MFTRRDTSAQGGAGKICQQVDRARSRGLSQNRLVIAGLGQQLTQ